MQPSDRKQFKTLIEALSSAFRTELTAPMLEGYWMALDDMPLTVLATAARRAMRECKFMPRAVELRELAGDVGNAARAAVAWGAVDKAMLQFGAYNSVSFDDPVVNAAIANLGGWVRFCDRTNDEPDFARKDFERVYVALSVSGVSPQQAAPLTGIFAQENALAGYEPPPVRNVATGLPDHSDRVLRITGVQKITGDTKLLEHVGRLPE